MNDALRRWDQRREIGAIPFRSACYAPFASLYFHTNGDVVACCKSTHHVLGNVQQQRLPEIWRGERIREMREALRGYSFGDSCSFCRWQIDSGHEHVHAAIYDSLQVSDGPEPWPRRMDFTMSNTCNLACRMCYGELSSTIRAHRDGLPPLPRAYDDRFFEDLREFLPHLHRATFMGGEPFLAAENFRVFDLLIADNSSCDCSVITNGTQWNARIERVLEALPMNISISVDGVTKEVVESIRINADFDRVMQNVRRFRDYTLARGTRMSLMYCLMQQNWHEFGRYLQLGEQLDVDVDMNVVVDPADCSLYELGPDGLQRVLDDLQREGDAHRWGELRRNGHTWRSTLESLQHSVETLRADAGRRNGPRPAADASGDPLVRAWHHVNAGEHDEALRLLTPIAREDSRWYQAQLCAAQALRALGHFDAAVARLSQAIEAWPRGAQAYSQRGWLLLDRGRIDDALHDAEQAHQRITATVASPLAADVARLLAGCHSASGRLEEALRWLEQLRPDDPNAYDVAAAKAWICRDLGRHDDADAAITAAIAIAPERPQAFVERAWLRLAQHRPDEALTAAEHAATLIRPERAQWDAAGVLHALVESLRRVDRIADAAEQTTELLRYRATEARFWRLRAELRQRLGDRAGADADLEQARQLEHADGKAQAGTDA
ncbi:MAG: tetratricopeptide repeat protein [Planctomycetota bacterium]